MFTTAVKDDGKSAVVSDDTRTVPFIVIGSGDGYSDQTVFNLYNQSDVPARLTVEFYGSDGRTWSVPLISDDGSLEGRYTGVNGTFDPHEGYSFRTSLVGEATRIG